MQDQLFRPVSVDEECAREISGIVILFRRLSVVYIIWMIITVTQEVYRIWLSADEHYASWTNFFMFKIYPFIYLTQLICGALNTYSFFKAFNMQKEAVALSDNHLFTESYRVFKTGIRIWVVLTIVALINSIIFGYIVMGR